MVAFERADYSKIEKLGQLNNLDTFWDDVRKLTKRVTSDHAIHRWQCLAEQRYKELKEEQSKKIEFWRAEADYGNHTFGEFTLMNSYDSLEKALEAVQVVKDDIMSGGRDEDYCIESEDERQQYADDVFAYVIERDAVGKITKHYEVKS